MCALVCACVRQHDFIISFNSLSLFIVKRNISFSVVHILVHIALALVFVLTIVFGYSSKTAALKMNRFEINLNLCGTVYVVYTKHFGRTKHNIKQTITAALR